APARRRGHPRRRASQPLAPRGSPLRGAGPRGHLRLRPRPGAAGRAELRRPILRRRAGPAAAAEAGHVVISAPLRSARPPIRRRRRLRWWIAGVVLTLVVLLGSALAVVRIQFEGPDLAQNLCQMMNARMRGKIEIKSIEWPIRELPKVVS